jgi:hypothetical protein
MSVTHCQSIDCLLLVTRPASRNGPIVLTRNLALCIIDLLHNNSVDSFSRDIPAISV